MAWLARFVLATTGAAMVLLTSGAAPATASDCSGFAPRDACLTLTPGSGPVGTRVRISGRILHDVAAWRSDLARTHYFALSRDFRSGVPGGPTECELTVAATQGRILLTADGRVRGSFVVGSRGSCRQRGGRYPPPPALYRVAIGCHTCALAEFRITSERLPFTGLPLLRMAAFGAALTALGVATLAHYLSTSPTTKNIEPRIATMSATS